MSEQFGMWSKSWAGHGWWPHPTEEGVQLEWILTSLSVTSVTSLGRLDVVEHWQCTGQSRLVRIPQKAARRSEFRQQGSLAPSEEPQSKRPRST